MKDNSHALSVYEVSKLFGCSSNYVHQVIEEGRLNAYKVNQTKRQILRIPSADAHEFYDKHVKNNNRIGRRAKLKPSRKPVLKKGYVMIHQPGHPKADRDGYVSEHVLVVEKRIGRYLTKKECVHHVDRDRRNNADENLVLYESQGYHMKEAHIYSLIIANKIKGNQELIDLVMKYIDEFNGSNSNKVGE